MFKQTQLHGNNADQNSCSTLLPSDSHSDLCLYDVASH